MCEFCPADGGECVVCSPPVYAAPEVDLSLLPVASAGRVSGRKGGDWRDNPYPPGTVEYQWFAAAQHEERTGGVEDGAY